MEPPCQSHIKMPGPREEGVAGRDQGAGSRRGPAQGAWQGPEGEDTGGQGRRPGLRSPGRLDSMQGNLGWLSPPGPRFPLSALAGFSQVATTSLPSVMCSCSCESSALLIAPHPEGHRGHSHNWGLGAHNCCGALRPPGRAAGPSGPSAPCDILQEAGQWPGHRRVLG